MLSHKVLTRVDAGDVASYYGDAADDYYAKEGEAQVWQGRGSEMLGLEGEVDAQRFRELLRGQVDPHAATLRDSTRADSKTRVGIDFTFSAPKSVSILALVGDLTDLIAAHDRAVTKVMEAVESQAQARRKVGGVSHDETTGNLIIAKFRHETTRAHDPELHTHAVILNLTRRSDGAWRALKNDKIMAMTAYLGAQYRNELARDLESQGYRLIYGREGTFEISGFSREALRDFSRRSVQIEARLADQGLTRETSSRDQRQRAALETRAPKSPQLDRTALHGEWRHRARQLNMNLGPRAGKDRSLGARLNIFRRPGPVAEAKAARQAVRYAIKHIMEREAVVTQERLLEVAFKHGVQGVRSDNAIYDAIRQEVRNGLLVREASCFALAGDRKAQPLPVQRFIEDLVAAGDTRISAERLIRSAIDEGRLVQAPVRYTTADALAQEREVLRIERSGRGAVSPICKSEEAARRVFNQLLTSGQMDAAILVLYSRNRVIGVEGYAGTGKSHMLRAANAEIDRAGYEMRALAPYRAQVSALEELGVKANTVAAFLQAKDHGLTRKSVLVIDEAGVVPARQMARLLKTAEAAGARVVLMGDRGQTKAIEAGRPFDQLIRQGMDMREMTEIKRQLDPMLKEAVGLAATGKTQAALDKVEHLHEIRDDHQRRLQIAIMYAKLTPGEREKTLILSGTNEARREINVLVRRELGLEARSIDVEFLVRRDTTQEERRYAKNFEVGDRIQPELNLPDLKLRRGEIYEVKEIGRDGRIDVADAAGRQIRFDPAKAYQLSVYGTAKAQLAAGDEVRITRNDPSLQVTKGDCMRVLIANSRGLTLTDGKALFRLPPDKPLHIDHAYATTVHSSQGLTADRVFMDVDTRRRTTAADTFYVALSRARIEARVFTDDLQRLPAALTRDNTKISALELQRSAPERQLDFNREADRRKPQSEWEMER